MWQMGYHVRSAAVGRDSAGRAGTGWSVRRRRFRSASFAPFVSPATSTHRHVPQSSSSGPISPARLAEVSRLSKTVIIEIAKLGIRGFTPRTFQ